MHKPNPTDAQQLKHGDTVVLLCGDFSPATLDYFRAAEVLASRSGINQVWLAPLASKTNDSHIQNMCTILATDITSSVGKQVGCCTAGISKKYQTSDELRAWCNRAYPNIKFLTATIASGMHKFCNIDIKIIFANEEDTVDKAVSDVVYLKEFLRQPSSLINKIKAGKDMSRCFPAPVWEYVQQFRLYR